MAHTHTHEEDRTTFYVAQLSTIGIVGLLGVVCLLLYQQNLLRFILAENRHFVVPTAGVILLVIVALRACVLFASSGRPEANDHCHSHDCDDHHDHDHDHCHAHDCDLDHEHAHEHEHEHEHVHEHVHAGNDHGHDHDHGWNPWRYIVLLLPIVLYFLNMPNAGFTAGYSKGSEINTTDLARVGRYADNTGLQIDKNAGDDFVRVVQAVPAGPAGKAGIKPGDLITQVTRSHDSLSKPLDKPVVVSLKGKSVDEAIKELRGDPQTKATLTIQHGGEERKVEFIREPDIMAADFKELEKGSYVPQRRDQYNGRVVQLKAMYQPGPNDRVFNLVRYKINCCAGDAQPVRVVVMLDPQSKEKLSDIQPSQWLEVTGRVQYVPKGDRAEEYLAVLVLASAKDVHETEAEPNPYIQ